MPNISEVGFDSPAGAKSWMWVAMVIEQQKNNMKISIPLRFKILHQPKYALVFYMDFFFKQNEGYENLHMIWFHKLIAYIYIFSK